jgi:PTH2 family peptidyl-tRNA hydrolase
MSETTSAVIVTTSIIAFISGFGLGVYAIRGWLISPELAAERQANLLDPIESEESDVDEEETLLDHAPNWANGEEADRRQGLRASTDTTSGLGSQLRFKSNEECKLVLVVRTDLGMTKGTTSIPSPFLPSFNPPFWYEQWLMGVNSPGKIAAQCSHATLACYKSLLRTAQRSPQSPEAQILRQWERLGQAKIAVQVKSEDELLTLLGKARSLGVTAEVISDAGRTQIASGSRTVLGVGPAPKSMVDLVTGGLKLL